MDEEHQMDMVDTNQPQADLFDYDQQVMKTFNRSKTQEIIQRDATGNNSTWFARAWNRGSQWG